MEGWLGECIHEVPYSITAMQEHIAMNSGVVAFSIRFEGLRSVVVFGNDM